MLRRYALLELFAVNMLIGIGVAVLAVCGLVALNVHDLGRLILADQSPVVSIGLLLFGFVVTFASVAMGSAVMTMGSRQGCRKQRLPRVPRS